MWNVSGSLGLTKVVLPVVAVVTAWMPSPAQSPDLVLKPKVQFVRRDFCGIVAAVTDRSITIRAGGALKEFAVSGPLAAGGYPQDLGWGCDYRLSDVRVGDRVDILYSRIGNIDSCTHVSIKRRPGGLVPPSPGEPKDTVYKWHERMNAYQAFEEKDTPIPEKYK